MLSNLQLYSFIAIGILILAFGIYFQYSQWRIEGLVATQTANTITIEQQKLSLDKFKQDVETIKNINKDLIEIERTFTENSVIVDKTLDNIIQLYNTDPVLATALLNEIQKERNRCYALATGAIQTKDETNTQCNHFLKSR